MGAAVASSTSVLSRMVFSACLIATASCGVTIPTPEKGPTPTESDIEVPYPPPPARVELIPAAKDPAQVWVDGQWDWSVDAWVWQRGQWTTPPPAAAYFTPWTTVRRTDGRLYFVPAAWRDKDGRALTEGTSRCAETAAPSATLPSGEPSAQPAPKEPR